MRVGNLRTGLTVNKQRWFSMMFFSVPHGIIHSVAVRVYYLLFCPTNTSPFHPHHIYISVLVDPFCYNWFDILLCFVLLRCCSLWPDLSDGLMQLPRPDSSQPDCCLRCSRRIGRAQITKAEILGIPVPPISVHLSVMQPKSL